MPTNQPQSQEPDLKVVCRRILLTTIIAALFMADLFGSTGSGIALGAITGVVFGALYGAALFA